MKHKLLKIITFIFMLPVAAAIANCPSVESIQIEDNHWVAEGGWKSANVAVEGDTPKSFVRAVINTRRTTCSYSTEQGSAIILILQRVCEIKDIKKWYKQGKTYICQPPEEDISDTPVCEFE